MSVVPPLPDGSGRRLRSAPATTSPQGTLDRSSRLPARTGPGERPTPVFRRRRRRTRLWMVLLLLTPVCLAVISLLSFATGGPPEPTVEPVSTPAGYTAITDADFGYAVPGSYHQNEAWTDQNADFLYGAPAAFVAETLEVAKRAPTASTVAPRSLESFGQPAPVAYTVQGLHPVRIPGTSVAWEETVTRPDGYRAVAVDAWERGTSTEIWLLVHSPDAVTGKVLASLRG